MRTRRLLRGLAAALAGSVAVSGCGEDSTAGDVGTDDAGAEDGGAETPDGDAAAEDGADAEAEEDGEEDSGEDAAEAEAWDGGGDGTLTVRVITEFCPPDEYGPLAGAAVALDAPGGGMTEAATDADGRVTFSTLDWSAGTAAVTAHAAGFMVASRVDITESEGEVVLVCNVEGGATPADWLVVSGDATGMLDASHGLGVTTTVGHWVWDGTGPSWRLPVPPETPFTLVAQEQHPDGAAARSIDQWTMLEVPALDAATTLMLDFATTLTPIPVVNSVTVPSRADSPLRSSVTAYWWATSIDSGLGLTNGQEETTVRSTDGNTWNLEGEYVVVPGVEQPVTLYMLWDGRARGVRAYVVVDGYPMDGPQDFRFLDVPRMISPPDAVERHPLHDPIEWESFDAEAGIGLIIYRAGVQVWTILAHPPTTATTLTVPRLPSTTSEATLLGTRNIRAQLFACADTDAVSRICRRAATTNQFVLQP
jgi:hypothetical protein